MTSLRIIISRCKAINQILNCSRTFNHVGGRHLVTLKRINVINPNFVQARFKYEKSTKNKSGKDADDDSDEESDVYEDLLTDKNSKLMKTSVNSLRADLLLKAGLGMARNKVELAFYESRIRVNGKKLLKKSINCKVGDEIDIVKGESPTNPDHLVVARIEVVDTIAKEESILVTMKRHKSLIIEKYENYKSSKLD